MANGLAANSSSSAKLLDTCQFQQLARLDDHGVTTVINFQHAREVSPRLKDWKQPNAEEAARAVAA
jgi:hypothetical protein